MRVRRPAAVIASALLAALLFAGCAGSSDPGQSSATTTPTPSRSASPSPTPTPTAETIEPTCENTSTAEFRAMMASNSWVSWTLPRDGIGGSPFDVFPGGAPTGGITCRWGADPELATDNILDLAWAPIGRAEATAAQEQLAAAGYERIEAPEGVYLAMKGEAGWADAEGYAQSYLFTDDDVRWAMFKAELVYVKAPDEVG
ncbi:MAG: hypothetical protein ABWY55_11110 [Microbacterium sp.]